MSLEITHGAWSGTCQGFNRFRRDLAKIEGFDLMEMDGFGGSRSWDEIKSELTPLLNHSDCDGEISWQDCKVIADRLKVIINAYILDSEDWFIEKAENFRIGCLSAYNSKENLKFR